MSAKIVQSHNDRLDILRREDIVVGAMNNPFVKETISSVVWVGVGLILVQLLRILATKSITSPKRPLPPGPLPKELSTEIPYILQCTPGANDLH